MYLMHNSPNRYSVTCFKVNCRNRDWMKKRKKCERKKINRTTDNDSDDGLKKKKNILQCYIWTFFGVFLSISLACNPYYIRIHLNETIFSRCICHSYALLCFEKWNSTTFRFFSPFFHLLCKAKWAIILCREKKSCFSFFSTRTKKKKHNRRPTENGVKWRKKKYKMQNNTNYTKII